MTKYVTEVLKELNDDPALFKTKYKRTGDGGVLELLFGYAFRPQGKFLLPEGTPPYKEDPAPIGMSPARFINEVKKFYLFCRADLTPIKRETIFIQLLESIHPDEAKVLIAIKDQNLTELYPNLTYDVIAEAGYLPPRTKEQAQADAAVVKTSARPRGRPRKSASPQPAQSETTL